MRKKFKIMYSNDHHEIDKRGKPYKPPANSMVVMNGQGIFFLYIGEEYYPCITPLHDILPTYDVIWK